MGMFAGMIAGAMGGGAQAVGQIADNQIQKQTRMDLSTFESQLQADRAAQLARLQQTMSREDQTYNTTGPGADEKLKFAGKQSAAQAEAERAAAGAYARDPNARAGIRAKAQDQHIDGIGAVASAEESRYGVTRKKAVDALLDDAARLESTGDAEGAEKKRREADTKRGTVAGKSYSDVVGAAKVLQQQAADLLDPMKGGDPSDPVKVARAQQLSERAAELAEGLASKRGVGGKSKPGAAPYAEGSRLTGPDGKFYIVKGGKPVLEGN